MGSMIDVYAVKIDKEIDKWVFNKHLDFLQKEKQLKIRKFHKFEDAQRSLLADILVRTVIMERNQISNNDIIFDENKYGKPFLKPYNNLEFNISHSGEWIVCAIHDYPVGIDIERISPIDFDIARRFFSKVEYNLLLSKGSSHELPFFYDLWSLKESYIKATGKGLSIPLNSFSISINGNIIEIYTQNQFKNCFFKQYNIDSNYKMAVCGCINNFCNEVIYKKIDQILEEVAVI